MHRIGEKVRNLVRSIAGINDRVSVQDRLDVRMDRAPLVSCIRCRQEVYYLNVDKGGVRHFAPTETQTVVRDDLLCPLCGERLCAFQGNRPMFRTDRGWK